jgi:outer membrane protein
MIPYNDLLKAEVELANARQDQIVAQNRLKVSQANFNTLLRRPISASVELEDIQAYTPLLLTLEECLDMAREHRREYQSSELQVEIAEREVQLNRKDYFPTVSLEGTYFRQESGFLVGAGDPFGFIEDPDGWDISAVATWNFWEWGRTDYSVKEKLSRLAQARYQRAQVADGVELEVKEAYLSTQDSESNILAVEKAVEQAKENFRITQQRYGEQMATTTDVLDAQTLLSRTLTNYYNALYDFKISKASLYRAMGLEEMP